MLNDSALRILIALVLAIMLIASGITGKPGSILGALIDTENMVEGDANGAGGTF